MTPALSSLLNEHPGLGVTMRVPEAGRLLGLGQNAAYRAAERGEIPTLRIGHRLVVPTAKLLAMLGLPDGSAGGGAAA